MSVSNKSQDECIIDTWINWAGYFCAFAHADTLTRPTKSIVLSETLQAYLSKNASIAPVATQLAGERNLYILSASWRVDSALSVWHAALATFTPLRRILGWKSVFPSPGNWCNQFNSALVQVLRVCPSLLLFPAPVLCWLSVTCALPRGNYPGGTAAKPRRALSVTRRRNSWKESVCRNVRGLSFRGETEKLGSKPSAHPLREQPSHPFSF